MYRRCSYSYWTGLNHLKTVELLYQSWTTVPLQPCCFVTINISHLLLSVSAIYMTKWKHSFTANLPEIDNYLLRRLNQYAILQTLTFFKACFQIFGLQSNMYNHCICPLKFSKRCAPSSYSNAQIFICRHWNKFHMGFHGDSHGESLWKGFHGWCRPLWLLLSTA